MNWGNVNKHVKNKAVEQREGLRVVSVFGLLLCGYWILHGGWWEESKEWWGARYLEKFLH